MNITPLIMNISETTTTNKYKKVLSDNLIEEEIKDNDELDYILSQLVLNLLSLNRLHL